MSEQSEKYDAGPEPGREQPQKDLSPAGMAAMRGDPGGDVPAAPPENLDRYPTMPEVGAGREPAPLPDRTPPDPGDRTRFVSPPDDAQARAVPPAVPDRSAEQPDPQAYQREPVQARKPAADQGSSPQARQAPEAVPEQANEPPGPADASDTPPAPRENDTLPDGSPTKITGDLHRFKDLNHQQGEVGDFQGTCGICAAQCVANEHGIPVSEADVLKKAVESKPQLCEADPNLAPEFRGGTTPEGRAELLTQMGVPSHVETGKNFDDLSKYIDDGKSVILSTNAGHLWDDPNYLGQDPTKTNHAVTLIDVAHDPQNDQIQGFFINDSGDNEGGRGSGRFVDLNTMRSAWLNCGGTAVVSDKSHR